MSFVKYRWPLQPSPWTSRARSYACTSASSEIGWLEVVESAPFVRQVCQVARSSTIQSATRSPAACAASTQPFSVPTAGETWLQPRLTAVVMSEVSAAVQAVPEISAVCASG